ncbi:hypothetical protein ALC57_00648, partial [Trachymyrmex cornetzi]
LFDGPHLMIFSISIFKGDTIIDIENIRTVTRCDVAVGRAPNKGARKGVGRVIVLFAIVAVASAGHYAEHIHINGGPVIPAPKTSPLALHGNDHTTRLHYSGAHIGHPHLVGVDHYIPAPHYEPQVANVAIHGKGWH